MTLLLAITAASFTALGTGIGLITGHTMSRRDYERAEAERDGEIASLHELYALYAYGDD